MSSHYGVDESLLGAPKNFPKKSDRLVHVPTFDVAASAGHGSFVEQEVPIVQFAFDKRWLEQLTNSAGSELSIIQVVGNSMEPTLFDGDRVMVDGQDSRNRLRDGIYVLRIDGALNVKRVAVEPKGCLAIISDNKAYPSCNGIARQSIDILGRVRWMSRALQ